LPIYEYRCTKCSLQFEVRRGFGENSSTPCPECQGEGQRLFSPVPIIFKGTGFYTTDNRKEDKSESLHETCETVESSPKAASEPEGD
jgi:putative FmdB family regulatory protein